MEMQRADWPQDGMTRELRWVGPTVLGPISSEKQVLVLLEDMDRSDHRTVKVGMGDFPTLRMGTKWQNGLRKGEAEGRHQLDLVTSIPEDCQILAADHRLPSGEFLIPASKYPLRTRLMLEAGCIAFPAKDRDSALIVIPCTEIFRAWYGRSSDLAKRLTAGAGSEVFDLIYNSKTSGVRGDGTWYVELRNGLATSDVQIAGMLACSDLARQRVLSFVDDQVRSVWRKASAVIRILPPIVGPTRIRAEGLFVDRRDSVFLVTRLIKVSFPPAPAEIDWNFEFDPRGDGSDDPDRPVAWPNVKAKRKAPSGQLRHRNSPTSLSDLTEEYVESAFFDAPKARRLPAKPPKYRSEPMADWQQLASDEHSTADCVASPDHPTLLKIRTAEASVEEPIPKIEDPPESSALAGGIELLVRIAALLRTFPEIKSVEALQLSSIGVDADGLPYSLFPEIAHIKKSSWPKVGEASRRLLAYEVKHRHRTAYIAEIERRLQVGDPKKYEKFSLAVIETNGSGSTPQELWTGFLSDTAVRRGHWPLKYPGFSVVRLKHTRVTDEQWANAIYKVLTNLPALPAMDIHAVPAHAEIAAAA